MVPVIVSVTSAAEDLSGAGMAQGIKDLTPKTSLVELRRMSVDSVASAVGVGLTALLVTVKLRCVAMVELQDASFSYGKEWDIHFGS